MPIHQLPIELFCTIFGHLAADKDGPALRACTLTCKALVSPAQSNLFRAKSIDDSVDVPRVLAKLQSTPHIRTFIKRLHLTEYHRPWIQDSEVLPPTLSLLSPSVTFLQIFQRRRKPNIPRFNYLLLSELKSLEEIYLREEANGSPRNGDAALPTFLNHFPNLRAITFEGTGRNQTIDIKSDITAPVFRLERLDMRGCADALVLDWLLPALSTLQTLRFSCPINPFMSYTTVARFMITAGGSLQHLQATNLNSTSDPDLQSLMTTVRTHNTSLRTLALTVNGSASPIEVVMQCLRFLGAHAHLQHLTIRCGQYNVPVDGSPWDDFQNILLGVRFPALRTAHIQLLQNTLPSVLVSIEPFLAAVPRLAQRQMISFSIIPWMMID